MADEMKLQSPEISEEKGEYAKVNSDRRDKPCRSSCSACC